MPLMIRLFLKEIEFYLGVSDYWGLNPCTVLWRTSEWTKTFANMAQRTCWRAFMFVLETGSENFDKFLNLLGDTVTLQGWAGYRGGLDTKSKKRLTASYEKRDVKARFCLLHFDVVWFLFCLSRWHYRTSVHLHGVSRPWAHVPRLHHVALL